MRAEVALSLRTGPKPKTDNSDGYSGGCYPDENVLLFSFIAETHLKALLGTIKKFSVHKN